MQECEVKYRLEGPEAHGRLRRRLTVLGARRRLAEHEENVLFDRPDGSLRAAGCVLRVRVLDGGPGGRLTFKGPAEWEGAVKARTELETAVADTGTLHEILGRLGFQPSLRYAKEREAWEQDGVEVALDTLAFGWFCEIEGPPAAIGRVASSLGLSAEAAEPAGYPDLVARYEAQRRADGSP
jgi:predicted adenylyl cyclase CyaB